jgi:hypothetical protein
MLESTLNPCYLRGAELASPCYLRGASGVTFVCGATRAKYSRTSPQTQCNTLFCASHKNIRANQEVAQPNALPVLKSDALLAALGV